MSDLISRQAVLESLKTDYSLIMFDSYGNLTFTGERIIEAIKRVPSVEPEQSQCSWYGEDGRCHFAEQEMDECDDCISRQAAIEAMEQRYCDIERVKKRPVTKGEQAIFLDMRGTVRSLPSVEPERKPGKWIRGEAYPHRIYCSECYKTFIPNDEMRAWVDGGLPRKYCPECGAKMEVDR